MRSRASLVKSGDFGRDPGITSTSGETQGRCADLRFTQKTPSIWDFPLFGFSVFLLLKYVSFLAASPAFRWQPPAGRAARENLQRDGAKTEKNTKHGPSASCFQVQIRIAPQWQQTNTRCIPNQGSQLRHQRLASRHHRRIPRLGQIHHNAFLAQRIINIRQIADVQQPVEAARCRPVADGRRHPLLSRKRHVAERKLRYADPSHRSG